MLAKNNKEEEYFLNELIDAIKEINAENIQSKEVLEYVIQLFALLRSLMIDFTFIF